MIDIKDINLNDSVDDQMLNNICNEYYFLLMQKTRNIFVSKSRNFLNLKDKKPKDWEQFVKFKNLCLENNLDYKKYIEFCIIESLNIHKFMKVAYLNNIKYIRLYNENEELNRQYNKINHYIINSFKRIIQLCKENNISNISEFIKYTIKNKKMGHLLKAGVISRYILCLIPNIKEIYNYFDEESKKELDIYVINKYDKLKNDAFNALQHNNNLEYLNIIKKINLELKNM